MAADQFLSFYTYYTVGFLWALFLRRFASPTFALLVVWHYWIYGTIVGPERFSSGDFHFFLPLTALFGLSMGYMLASLVNLRRLIFWKEWDVYGWWLPLVLFEFILLHLVLALWESTGTVARPLSYLLTFLAYALLIPFFYFVTREFDVWAYWNATKQELSTDDHAAARFHLYWAEFHLSATLIFLVFEWILPDAWPFWFALASVVFHILLYVMISLFVVGGAGQIPYKHGRKFVVTELRKRTPANVLMDLSLWGESSSSNNRQEMDVLPTTSPGAKKAGRGYSASGSVSDSDTRKFNTNPLVVS